MVLKGICFAFSKVFFIDELTVGFISKSYFVCEFCSFFIGSAIGIFSAVVYLFSLLYFSLIVFAFGL